MSETVLVWLRNELRLSDNPALDAALAGGQRVVVLHIEETDATLRRRGAASRWWLHHSLAALAADLGRLGIALETLAGEAHDCLARALGAHKAETVHWNRRYGPAERSLDAGIKQALRRDGIAVHSHPGNVLVEPFEIATRTGGPYAVFTPFWAALRARDIARPRPMPPAQADELAPAATDTTYAAPVWAAKFSRHWSVGEVAAQQRLLEFLEQVGDYPQGRDIPGREATSRLSPHVAFGEISVRQIWHAAQAIAQICPERAGAIDKYLSELAWRDFHIHQLYHRPDIATVGMQAKFDGLAWRHTDTDLVAWQRGETGIPIIDAGMNELWETGFMHNRVRMLVASLLCKNLLLDWRLGEQWFWDCLVDADPASNPGNWQWVAGCGNDAAPYFRIFNPLTQAEKFDPDGTYVRRWAPDSRPPIVDLKSSRERALAAFRSL